MDVPISYAHMPSECGWFALGILAGFVFATVYWYWIYGRAYVNTNDLRSVYPSWRFTRSRNAIIGYYRNRMYIVGGKFSTFSTVCDNVESIMERDRYER